MDKNTKTHKGCYIIFYLFVIGTLVVLFITANKYKKRDEFVKDSLLKVTLREIKENESWNYSHSLVITCDSDNVYHTSTKCNSLDKRVASFKHGTENINNYRLTTKQDAINLGYHLCYDCEEIEFVYEMYENDKMKNEDYENIDDLRSITR